MTTRRAKTRRGFTLTEMMVAMALSLGIMLILAEAFQSATSFVRIANANSQLMNQLAGAGNRLEHDLMAQHFTFEAGKPNGGVRLSDQWAHRPGYRTPRGGFFRIEAAAPTIEGTDIEGNTLSTATNHRLHFTSILKGGTDAEFFTAISPSPNGAVYRSRAAEVAWFWVPNGQFTSANAGTRMELGTLVRRWRLLAIDDDSRDSLRRAIPSDTLHAEVISVPPPPNTAQQVNTLADVRNPVNRLQLPAPGRIPQNSPATFQPGSARYGEDIVATNVLSFQVLVWGDQLPRANSAPWPRPYPANTEAPFDYFQSAGGVFDTALIGTTGPTASPAVRIRAIQVTIRIADTRVGIARSNTWKFEM